ncbi:MAG: transporter substrate-binding domain-containing protein [Spirochaetes bacterium]|nr:transporter substrate-binding domain-containing protein [Spirochaetota bacterium]
MKRILLTIVIILCVCVFGFSQFRMVTNDSTPTGFNLDGKMTGTSITIVEGILEYMGKDVEIEVYPWARAYKIAQEEPNVIIFTAGKTQERIDLGFHFIGPIITRKHSLWKLKSAKIKINAVNDLKKLKYSIGALQGDWRGKYFTDMGIEIDYTSSHQSNLEKLISKRIDLWATSDIEAPNIAKKANINFNKIELVYVISEASSYFMISKGTDPKIIKAWEDAFKHLESTNYMKKKTNELYKKLNMKFDYKPGIGYFLK